jgi:hypothetical protein
LTKLATTSISHYIEHAIFNIGMTLWAHEGKTIMTLMDEEEGKPLVKKPLEVAWDGRKRKQAERRQMTYKRGLRLQDWCDKVDPLSPSPEAQEDIPVIIREDAVLEAYVGSAIEEQTRKRFMEELNRLASIHPEIRRIESSQNFWQCDSLLFFGLRLLEQRSALRGP